MSFNKQTIHIVGGGLAGSECALQLAYFVFNVVLYELSKKEILTPAHKTTDFAELVCSNSFRGAALTNAVGLLKEELRQCGSHIMHAADDARVPAGGAFAVDREKFSQGVDTRVRSHKNIKFYEGGCFKR